MKSFIKKKLTNDIIVFPPSIDDTFYSSEHKRNIIVSTGRFFSHLHSKKQHLLVEAFKHLYDKEGISDWRLVLIGSVENEDSNEYLNHIKSISEGYPIDVLTNISFSNLREYYAKSKLFWLATGFGEDLEKHPERAEHFGIVTLEAMASGCVPIVFNGGGQKELVQSGIDGYFFNTKEELLNHTTDMIKNERKREEVSKRAIEKSKEYKTDHFIKKLHEILK